MSYSSRLLSLLAAAVLLVVGTHSANAQHKTADIIDTAVAAGSFETLAAALTAADLIDALKGDGPFTVFAPTDQAFASLPDGTLESLLKPENKDKLVAILTYHVVPGRVTAKKVVRLSAAETLNGQRVDIAVNHGDVTIDNATVTATDVMASNGVIHVIDRVILPTFETIPTVAANAGTFNTLLTAVREAGLADVLGTEGPFTVLAPTDDAFEALPEGTVSELLKPENRGQLQTILKYHVISGRVFSDEVAKASSVETLAGETVRVSTNKGGVRINAANVVATDIDAINGVIHVIDAVLLPPAERSSVDKASTLIEMAINRGAPLYNHGQAAATTAIYEVAAHAILAMDDVPQEVRQALKKGLREMRSAPNSDRQAWTMRYALDDAMGAMSSSASRSH